MLVVLWACCAGAAEQGCPPGQPPSLPTWFLTAIAAADLPENAPPQQVQARLADAVHLLDWLQAQALELFVRRGSAAGAWAALEAGLLEVHMLALPCRTGPEAGGAASLLLHLFLLTATLLHPRPLPGT